MQVIRNSDGALTGLEVKNLIEERKAARATNVQSLKPHKDIAHRDYIESKLITYFNQTATSKWTTTGLRDCLREIKALNYGLTEAELVHIADLAPSSEIEFYLAIDKCSERLDEEKIAKLIEIVSRHVVEVGDSSKMDEETNEETAQV